MRIVHCNRDLRKRNTAAFPKNKTTAVEKILPNSRLHPSPRSSDNNFYPLTVSLVSTKKVTCRGQRSRPLKNSCQTLVPASSPIPLPFQLVRCIPSAVYEARDVCVDLSSPPVFHCAVEPGESTFRRTICGSSADLGLGLRSSAIPNESTRKSTGH